VIALRLAEIAAAVGGTLHGGDPDALVDGTVEFDSRKVTRGGLFVAFAGGNVDGHDFAAAAVAAGAAGVLGRRAVAGVASIVVEDPRAAMALLARYCLDRLPDTTVVGLTGSSGKTTTKDYIAQLLAPAGPTVAPAGSFNNELGHPYTVLQAGPATRWLVLELGARGIGHVRYLCAVAPPRIGVVLNVGGAHIGEFGTVDAIARAKGELVEALPADGVAVLNADDPRVAAMAARTGARAVTFGAHADVRAEALTLDAGRARFRLVTPSGSAPVALRLVGAHHVGNALAAAAVAGELGGTPEAVAATLSAAAPASRWRMEVMDRADGVTVVNDAYNANPDSMAAALRALAALAVGRRTWAVLGPMQELGSESAAAHADVARLAKELGVDELVTVDSPDYGAGRPVPDVAAATALLRAELAPGDVVLVKASRAAGLDRIAAELLGGNA
jgi:UDP-N-acetylmuramoyl-tripeptide--D-alanyl-D-alanine ligase